MTLIDWAAIVLRGDGVTVAAERCSGSRTGPGVYTIELDNEAGQDELFVEASVAQLSGFTSPAVTVENEVMPNGRTIVIRAFSILSLPIGLPIDCSFRARVSRFMP